VLDRKTHSVDTLVQSALVTVGPMADKHAVDLRANLDDSVGDLPVDEVKMRQVLVNLLSNAIKFSPRGGVVEVVSRVDGGAVQLEVKDQGPGVRSEDRATIFELFGQGAQKGANERGGLGIGLHLVRRIVELHGGSVGIDHPQGGGSLFWVRIPRTEAASLTDDAKPAADRAAA